MNIACCESGRTSPHAVGSVEYLSVSNWDIEEDC